MEDEFSPEARMALDALRQERPTSEARARVRERMLAGGVAVGASTLVASGAKAASSGAKAASVATQVTTVSVTASTAGGSLASLSGVKLALVLAGLGTLGTGAGVAVMTRLETGAAREQVAAAQGLERSGSERSAKSGEDGLLPPAPQVSALSAPNEPEASRNEHVEALPVPKHTEEPREPPTRTSARPSRVRERAPSQAQPPMPESALRAESVLLLRALTSFEAGEACQALGLLDEHAQKFGANAGLAPERERMRKRFLDPETASGPLACQIQKGPVP